MQKLNNELELGRVDVKTATQRQNWKESKVKLKQLTALIKLIE